MKAVGAEKVWALSKSWPNRTAFRKIDSAQKVFRTVNFCHVDRIFTLCNLKDVTSLMMILFLNLMVQNHGDTKVAQKQTLRSKQAISKVHWFRFVGGEYMWSDAVYRVGQTRKGKRKRRKKADEICERSNGRISRKWLQLIRAEEGKGSHSNL